MIYSYHDITKQHQVLDKDGKLLKKDYKIPLTKDEIQKAFKNMYLCRVLDNRMLKMQRQGKLLTFPPNLGEEAYQTATAMAMSKNDMLFPGFRVSGAMIYLGVPIWKMLALWNGNEIGNNIPNDVNVAPINIPIGTQCSHAAGYAYASKLLKRKSISFCFIGDGGTCEGEFFEAMNIAAVQKWPVIFCINNNQWAISTPTNKETNLKNLCTRAIGVGLDFIHVDGNDLFASYEVVKEAIEYVKNNSKPILIEFKTYRMGPHTTSDDTTLYRTKEYEKKQEEWDPIKRIENYILENKIMTRQGINKMLINIEKEIDLAIKKMEDNIEVTIDDIFDYTYEKLPKHLVEQKEECKKFFLKK